MPISGAPVTFHQKVNANNLLLLRRDSMHLHSGAFIAVFYRLMRKGLLNSGAERPDYTIFIKER